MSHDKRCRVQTEHINGHRAERQFVGRFVHFPFTHVELRIAIGSGKRTQRRAVRAEGVGVSLTFGDEVFHPFVVLLPVAFLHVPLASDVLGDGSQDAGFTVFLLVSVAACEDGRRCQTAGCQKDTIRD